MVRAGETLDNRLGRHRLLIRRTTAEVLEMEATYAPHGQPPPNHHHPNQEERFQVLSGTLQVRLAGEERTLAAGDTLTIPPGCDHCMWNASADEATTVWETRPALSTAEFFETATVLGDRLRNPLQLAVVLSEFRDEFRLSVPLLGPLIPPLAWLGRLLGFRGRHPR